MKLIYFIVALAFFISCSNSQTRCYKTKHFKIFYTNLDDRDIKEIADSLENNYPGIITNLHSKELPIVNVHFYANINKNIGNNPRWLWEAIAIYEANLPWDPHTLPYLVSGHPPSINELNQSSNTRIYEVGHFIGEFIVETKGTSALNELIKNNGNIQETLNMNDEEFTQQWFAFIRKKYDF